MRREGMPKTEEGVKEFGGGHGEERGMEKGLCWWNEELLSPFSSYRSDFLNVSAVIPSCWSG